MISLVKFSWAYFNYSSANLLFKPHCNGFNLTGLFSIILIILEAIHKSIDDFFSVRT